MEEEHSKIFPPSGGHRWIACAGSSILIVRHNIQDSAGEAAHIGTVCHDIAFKILTGQMTVSPVGQTFEGVLITDKLFEGIKLYCKRVKKISQHVGGNSQYEAKVHYDQECFGTVDASHLNPSMLYLQDLKMGEGLLVLAKDNEQLKIYDLAALRTMIPPGQPLPPIIINEIIQPLYRDEIPVKTDHIFTKELFEWEKDTLQPAMNKIRTGLAIPFEQPLPDTYFNPGEKQCKWCGASAFIEQNGKRVRICEAFGQAATESAAATFQQFVTKPNPDITKPEMLPANQVVEIYKKLPLLETFISEMKRHMKHNVGLSNPGFEEYKMVAGLGNSAWVDATAAQSYLKGLGLGYMDINEAKFKSPTQIKKHLKDAKIEAPNLDQYIFRPETDPKLVPADDPRNKVTESPQETFQKTIQHTTTGRMPATSGNLQTQALAGNNQAANNFNPPSGDGIAQQNADITLPPPEKDSGIEPHPAPWNFKTQKKGGYLHRARGEVIVPNVPDKRAAVMQYAGQKTIAEVAKLLKCTESNVKNHIKAINVKNGYETCINTDGTFDVVMPAVDQEPIELTDVAETGQQQNFQQQQPQQNTQQFQQPQQPQQFQQPLQQGNNVVPFQQQQQVGGGILD